MDWFGNNQYDGYSAKAYEYKPTWEKQVDYSPDRNPAAGLVVTVLIGDRLVRMWHMRGLGVMMADMYGNETGTLEPRGLSIFTKEDIGWAPNL